MPCLSISLRGIPSATAVPPNFPPPPVLTTSHRCRPFRRGVPSLEERGRAWRSKRAEGKVNLLRHPPCPLQPRIQPPWKLAGHPHPSTPTPSFLRAKRRRRRNGHVPSHFYCGHVDGSFVVGPFLVRADWAVESTSGKIFVLRKQNPLRIFVSVCVFFSRGSRSHLPRGKEERGGKKHHLHYWHGGCGSQPPCSLWAANGAQQSGKKIKM